jgi:hypothetical protein
MLNQPGRHGQAGESRLFALARFRDSIVEPKDVAAAITPRIRWRDLRRRS